MRYTRENFAAQAGDFGGERGRAAGRLGLPERQRRRHPGRGLDQETVARDSQHPPRHRAEREDVAAGRLLGEVFLDVADLAPLRLDHDVEVAAFGNCAARGDRGHPRAAPRAHARADPIVEDFRRRALDPRRQFRRHLLEQMGERGAIELAEVVRATQQAQQVGFANRVVFGRDRDDLLRRDVEASRRNLDLVEPAVANRAHRGGALEQVVECEREQAPLGA